MEMTLTDISNTAIQSQNEENMMKMPCGLKTFMKAYFNKLKEWPDAVTVKAEMAAILAVETQQYKQL